MNSFRSYLNAPGCILGDLNAINRGRVWPSPRPEDRRQGHRIKKGPHKAGLSIMASPRGLLRGLWPLALRAGRLRRSSELAPAALGSNPEAVGRWELGLDFAWQMVLGLCG